MLAKKLFGPNFLSNDDRERIKRCAAHFIIRPNPGAIQVEVAYSMLDALEDDHLLELDVMVHAYELGAKVN